MTFRSWAQSSTKLGPILFDPSSVCDRHAIQSVEALTVGDRPLTHKGLLTWLEPDSNLRPLLTGRNVNDAAIEQLKILAEFDEVTAKGSVL